MRHAGNDYADIAESLAVSVATARKLVADALEAFAPYAEAEALRDLEAGRLDRAQAAIWQQVLAGDLQAVKTFLGLSERRSKLLGLDAPAKVAVAIVNVEADEYRERLNRILADDKGRALLMDLTKKIVDGDTIDVEVIERGGNEEPARAAGADQDAASSPDCGDQGDGLGPRGSGHLPGGDTPPLVGDEAGTHGPGGDGQ